LDLCIRLLGIFFLNVRKDHPTKIRLRNRPINLPDKSVVLFLMLIQAVVLNFIELIDLLNVSLVLVFNGNLAVTLAQARVRPPCICIRLGLFVTSAV
jgi:hypothetical protein